MSRRKEIERKREMMKALMSGKLKVKKAKKAKEDKDEKRAKKIVKKK